MGNWKSDQVFNACFLFCFVLFFLLFGFSFTCQSLSAGVGEPFLISRVIKLDPSSSFSNKRKAKKRAIIVQKLLWRRGCQAINAESSPLHIASNKTRTKNFWFPSLDFFDPRPLQRPLRKICLSLQNLASKAGGAPQRGELPD